MATAKLNQRERAKVAEAYARCATARRVLCDVARPMECTEDPAGIVWERFVCNNGRSLILFATPVWWDVFAPCTDDPHIAPTLEAIKEAARAAREIPDDDDGPPELGKGAI